MTDLRLAKPTLLSLLVAVGVGCTTLDDGSRAHPTAGPSDGWIELAIDDPSVPADPLGDPGARTGPPPPCELELELGGSQTLLRKLSPRGDAPPYVVRETLRVPAPPGAHRGTLHYSGCRTAWGQLDSRDVDVALVIHTGYVTRLEFDGSTLLTYPPAPR